jgi:hypothetical protein
LDAFFDDGATDSGVTAHGDLVEEHGFLDFTIGVDANAITQHTLVDTATGDDAAA